MVATGLDLSHAHAPVHAPLLARGIVGEAQDTNHTVTRIVEERMAAGGTLDGMFIALDVPVLGRARGHLFVEVQIDWDRGEGPQVTSVEDMVECGDRGRGVIRCAPVALAQGPFHDLAHVLCHILRIRDIVGVEAGPGLIVEGGEVTAEMISGIAGLGPRGLRPIF